MALPVSRRLDFSEIPVIDLARLTAGDTDTETVAGIGSACRDVGFFYIENHGVEPELVHRLHTLAKAYFAQALEAKMQTKLDARMRGYLPLDYCSFEGEENAAINHQEGFWIGHDRPLDETDLIAGPNQWPSDMPEFKAAMMKYFGALEKVADVLIRGFALALDLSENYFTERFNRPNTRLKLNHYPPQENPQHQYEIGVLPHADSGGFTILWQDESGGLEIQNKSGEWVGAPPIKNTFVINLGKIMQTWTNGQFSATPHRVVNRSGEDRYSIPLFVNPNSDVVIEPLVGERSDGFVPFRYGDYQRDEWRRAFPVAGIPIE